MKYPDPNLPWPIALEGVRLIAESEDCRLDAYLCPAGVPTIGWGHTEGVRLGDTCTQEQADRMLLDDLALLTGQVRALLKVDATPMQLAAMVCFAYNVGVTRFAGSSVLKRHNLGDFAGAARIFGLWVNITDPKTKKLVKSPGLVKRRAHEAALYLSDLPAPVPQEVAPERKPAQSKIIQGATIAATLPVVQLATDARSGLDAIEPALASAKAVLGEGLGLSGPWVFAILGLIVAALIIRWRLQHHEGDDA